MLRHNGPTNQFGHRAFAVLTHDTIPVTVAASGYLTKTTNVSVDGDEIVTVTLQTPAPGAPTIIRNAVRAARQRGRVVVATGVRWGKSDHRLRRDALYRLPPAHALTTF